MNSLIPRDKKYNGDCQGLRGRNGELLFNGYRVLVYKMKRGLEMDGGNGCICVNVLNSTETVYFKMVKMAHFCNAYFTYN